MKVTRALPVLATILVTSCVPQPGESSPGPSSDSDSGVLDAIATHLAIVRREMPDHAGPLILHAPSVEQAVMIAGEGLAGGMAIRSALSEVDVVLSADPNMPCPDGLAACPEGLHTKIANICRIDGGYEITTHAWTVTRDQPGTATRVHSALATYTYRWTGSEWVRTKEQPLFTAHGGG